MEFTIRPPREGDRKVVGGTVIAVVEHGEVTHPIVRVEQAEWVDSVHFSREHGDSKYGYVLYLPACKPVPQPSS